MLSRLFVFMNKYKNLSLSELYALKAETEKSCNLLAFNSSFLRQQAEMKLCFINAAISHKTTAPDSVGDKAIQ
jgi:hypothetical protein